MEVRLSKSRYCNAVQCPKMLWMKKYRPEQFDESVMDESVLATGNEVGDLAMGLLGPYTEVPFSEELTEMLRVTQELLEQGTEIITEASFSYENCFCSVDILKNLGGRRVELYEVKSSTKVNEYYYDDVSYQYYVLTQLGYTVEKACLVYLNKEYVRHGELVLQELFTMRDMTDEARTRFPQVEERIREIKAYMAQTEEPDCPIGEHCSSPHDCGFRAWCFRNLPRPNIFDLAAVQQRTKWKNYRDGIVSFEDIRRAGALSDKAQMQVAHELDDLPAHIDRKAVAACLKGLSYPLYFLDFESFNPAVPPYDDTHPYEQIVFQYSLHFIEREGGPLEHCEFLASPGGDPRRALAEQLCRDIPRGVCTVAYNMTFERTCIRGLAALFPDLAAHLLDIAENMRDLMIPFRDRAYYSRAMQGSYSIKYVLPALFPGDPALDYHNLEGVHNGAEASSAFKRMASMAPDELEAFRGHLLKYCGLDTFAMVKIWEKLHEAAGR